MARLTKAQKIKQEEAAAKAAAEAATTEATAETEAVELEATEEEASTPEAIEGEEVIAVPEVTEEESQEEPALEAEQQPEEASSPETDETPETEAEAELATGEKPAKTTPPAASQQSVEKPVKVLTQPVAAFKAELDRYIERTNPVKAKTESEILADQSLLYRALLRIWRMSPRDMLRAIAIADAYWTEHRNTYFAPVKTWRLCAAVKLPSPKSPMIVKQTLSLLESVANTSDTAAVKTVFSFDTIKKLVSDEAKDVLSEYFKL